LAAQVRPLLPSRLDRREAGRYRALGIVLMGDRIAEMCADWIFHALIVQLKIFASKNPKFK
jgi:hypothetical protein